MVQQLKKITNKLRENWLTALFVVFVLIWPFWSVNQVVKLFESKRTEAPVCIDCEKTVMGGAGDDRMQWIIFSEFDGYQTKADPQKISRGGNPVGQNTYINDGDRISVRDLGFEIFPDTDTVSSSADQINSLFTFKKRDGTNIMLRAFDDELEYYHDSISRWERLKDGFTADQTFGFAIHNTNVDQTSLVYFGNARENYQRWTGNVAELSSASASGTTTLYVDSTTLFPATGSVIFCGTSSTYTAKTATTFTIPTTTLVCATGRGVAQIPTEYAAAPKGNILTTLNTRMFIAGVTSSTEVLFYSTIADATDFTYSVPRSATDGGIISMPEGGGPIVGMAIDEELIYVFKENIIKTLTFTQDADDLPVIKPLKPFDGKSQTVGAKATRAIFAGGNGLYFITPNNEIMNITRVVGFDYPQVTPISDIIKPTVDGLDFSAAVGVYWKNKAYFSVRQSTDSIANDVILVYNYSKRAWESPIVGIGASDFTIAKFVTEDLYFGDANQPNVYKITNTPIDGDFSVTANWRSREETFDAPHILKSIDNFFVEGYITEDTTLKISLLYDEDGYTQTLTTDFVGNENNNQYRFVSESYNMFGLNPFGYERFGSNDDYSTKKKFRMYLNKNLRRIPFYSIQVEFGSDGENQQWEILSYGMHVMAEPQSIKTLFLRAF